MWDTRYAALGEVAKGGVSTGHVSACRGGGPAGWDRSTCCSPSPRSLVVWVERQCPQPVQGIWGGSRLWGW